MARTREDRLFDRFRRTGDARALATVFDKTAPEIWRVAAHLCPDRHRAEDLVQTTFLVALESANAWDPDRPVLPWLLGILANQARHSRRREGRELDHAKLPAPGDLPGPEEQAARAELADALRDALRRVPETYRDSLREHLLTGRRPAEIARSRGVAAGTVRMQIHRGMEHLRRFLSRDFVPAGAAVGAISAGSLAQVRRNVLARVTGPAATTGVSLVSIPIGAIVMKKLSTFVAVAGALVFALLFAWPDSDPEALSDPTANGGLLARGNSIRADAPRQRAPDRAARSRVAQAAGRKASSAKEVAMRLEVTVVDIRGKPVPGAVIVGKTSDLDNLSWGEIGRTDDSGVWHHDSVAATLSVGAMAPGRVPSFFRHVEGAGGERIEVLLSLRGNAATVRGTVRDLAGAAAPGVRVLVQAASEQPRLFEPIVLQTDARGRFQSSSVAPGTCRIVALSRDPAGGPGRAGSTTVEVGRAGADNVEVRMVRGATVTGTLRRAGQGPAVPGEKVCAAPIDPLHFALAMELTGRCRTDANGAFRMDGLLPGRYRLQSWIGDARVHRVVDLADRQVLRWDPEHSASMTLRLRVRGPDGKPLAGCRIVARHRDAMSKREGRTDEAGRCGLSGAADIVYDVRVFPAAGFFAIHGTKLRPTAGEHEIRVAPRHMPSARIAGRVVADKEVLENVQLVVRRLQMDGVDYHITREEYEQAVLLDKATGHFELGPVPPGYYGLQTAGRLFLKEKPEGRAPAGGRLDLGDIEVAEPASLLVVARNGRGEPVSDAEVFVRREGDERYTTFPTAEETKQGLLYADLPQVSVEVLITGKGVVAERRKVTILAGRRTKLAVTCRDATRCSFTPTGKRRSGAVHAWLYVIDEVGEIVQVGSLGLDPGATPLCRALVPGKYVVEVRTSSGRTSQELVVPDQQDELAVKVRLP